MKESVIQKLSPQMKEESFKRTIRNTVFAILLMTVSILVVRQTMGEDAPAIGLSMAVGLVGLICMAISSLGKQKNRMMKMTGLLPWIGIVLLYRPWEWIRGFQWWMNQIISGWNETYDGGIALYQVQSGIRDQMAIAWILIILCAEISWKLVSENRTFFCAVFCFGLILLQLLSGSKELRGGIWLLFVLLSLLLSQNESWPVRRTIVWEAGIFLFVLLCSIGISQKEITGVAQFRDQTKESVQNWRYGKKVLPEGDLTQSSKLRESTDDMMSVQTDQEKNLYLRGFTGGRYDSSSGKWYPLSQKDYGNENSGLFRWLKKQGFDPLTQVADYYKLGEESQIPEENHLKILVSGARREYFYVPCSLNKTTSVEAKKEKDIGIRSKGITGARSYELQEISGIRPSELVMAEQWVTNPENDEQAKYLEAEAVYRDFVYEHEMDVDEDLKKLIQDIFWKDYTTEQDGIYSALQQIRTVLKDPAFYAKKAGIEEENSDPVSWFLTGDHTVNDMYYATAATLAFRVYGIPARYAEGYYISDQMVQQQDGSVDVTGQNAHAWVEVYFDGIGWLPLDVTPGYYYESVELQEMISLPNTVQKTAAVENSQSEAEQLSGAGGKEKLPPEKIVKYSLYTMLGILAILVLLLTIAVVGMEGTRSVWIWKCRREYLKADQKSRVQMLHHFLYRILACRGITGKLGWQMEETDQAIADEIDGISPGMYRKVSSLLEKSIYGETDLEVYEERTIKSFLQKIAQVKKKDPVKLKLKMRYGIWGK